MRHIPRIIWMLAGLLLAIIAAMPAAAQAPRPRGGNATSWYAAEALLHFANENRTVTGKAEYRHRTHMERFEQRLQVHVRNAAPLRMVLVRLNGAVIGGMQTDLFGNGLLFLRSDFDGGAWEVTPEGFPVLQPGDVIMAGRAAGTIGAAPRASE